MQRKNITGQNIRRLRKEAHVTQMALAAQMQLLSIKIDRSGIAKLESGIRPITDIEVAAIAKILKIPITLLYENCIKFFGD